MARRFFRFMLFVVVPIGIMAAYVLARAKLAEHWQRFIYAENGPVELGTALFFATASCLAMVLAHRTRESVPLTFRVMFLLFALACGFVALEEISYGQQIFGWKSPDWFEKNNHHHQTNLHNLMGNRPSHVLKHIADYGSLIGFVLLPLASMVRKGSYQPTHWTYYLLPRAELLIATALAQLCSVLWDSPASLIGDYWHQGLNEVREMYWGLTAFLYVIVMRHRLVVAPPSIQHTLAEEARLQRFTASKDAA